MELFEKRMWIIGQILEMHKHSLNLYLWYKRPTKDIKF